MRLSIRNLATLGVVTLLAACAGNMESPVFNLTAEDVRPHGGVTGTVENLRYNGGTYSGGTLDGHPHGSGRFQWDTGEVYEGKFRFGQRDGEGRFLGIDGSGYQGAYQHDRYSGKGRLLQPDGTVYEGEFRAGRKHGEGILIVGERRYQGEFSDDAFVQGYSRAANGDEYNGGWRDLNYNGTGVLTDSNGTVWQGAWYLGRKAGPFLITLKDGTRYKRSYRSDVLDGESLIARRGATNFRFDAGYLDGKRYGRDEYERLKADRALQAELARLEREQQELEERQYREQQKLAKERRRLREEARAQDAEQTPPDSGSRKENWMIVMDAFNSSMSQLNADMKAEYNRRQALYEAQLQQQDEARRRDEQLKREQQAARQQAEAAQRRLQQRREQMLAQARVQASKTSATAPAGNTPEPKKSRQPVAPEMANYSEAMALCVEFKSGGWKCHGPIQKMWAKEDSEDRGLSDVGCTGYRRKVAYIPPDGDPKTQGFVYFCGYGLETYQDDVVKLRSLPQSLLAGRETYTCPKNQLKRCQ